MKLLYCTFFVFACICLTEGRVYQLIDAFDDNQGPLVVQVRVGGDTTYPYDWWSPYYEPGDGGGEPGFLFFDTDAAWGGQRDNVLGYESASSRNSVAVLSIVGDAASVAFPLQYAGGAYFQWDGDDTGNSGTAFPGARLNSSPGIGSGEPSVANPDGQSIDFTFGGRAIGIYIEIKADHFVNYFFDAIDASGQRNELAFDVDPPNGNTAVPFFWRFDDLGWDNPLYDWTRTAGFQVRIFTFAGTSTENAVDSEFRLLRIVGYQVSGSVVTDCLCDSVIESVVVGAQVNLFRRGAPIAFATTVTDSNGDYLFDSDQLDAGDYTVCLDDLSTSRCPTSSSGCIDFTLANFFDAIDLDFFLTVSTTLNLPPDRNLNCGDCTDPSCTGFATASGCEGGNQQINNFSDSTTTSNSGCVVTIRRTWVDPDTNQSGVQTITLTDSDAPVINPTASDRTQTCEQASTYSAWISSRAGAIATDCTSFVWSASANSAPIRCDFETVTFTATDPCGQSSRTTATYTVTDNINPSYTTQARDSSAECDLKGSTATSALNQWVSSRGGSQVSDNCATSGQLTFTNDFVGVTNGCGDSDTVTFITSDGCGNSAATTATFTISDNTRPQITTQASPQTAQCSRTGADNTAFQSWLSNRAGARATDNCIANDNNLIWTNSFTGSSVGGAGTCNQDTTVTFTVTDPCGFTQATTATFTVRDTTNPSFTSTASSRTSQCDGTGNSSDFDTWIANNGGAAATDSCSTVTFTNDNTGAPATCGESRTVTFSATDSCGNGPIRTTASFTVVDNTPPTFVTRPQDDTVECSSTSSSEFDNWLANDAFATITDACSNSGIFISNDFQGTTLNSGCNSVATVRFFANDPCGNISPAQTATFRITDTTAPVISPGASDRSEQCDFANNQASYQNFLSTRGGAQATDSCGVISWSNNGPSTFQTGCDAGQVVTFIANDGCANTAATTASFTINDSTLPTLVTPAADRTVECNGNGNQNDLNNWLTTRGGATATDNCGSVTWTNDFTALSGGCVSSARVTFTGCDPCQLCISTTATFTINDTSSPVINPQASPRSVECDPSSNENAFDSWVADNGGARASDICEDDADLVWSSSFQNSPFGCDSEIVTFTVTDLCGRTASTTATFTIRDSVSPTINPRAADVQVECDGNGNSADYNSFISSRGGAGATDVCAFTLTWINNAPVNGPVGCGTQQVVFTVEDECLNSASTTATYRVIDSAGPTLITPATARTVECSDSNSNLAAVQSWLNEQGGATAVDSCYGSTFTWTNNFTALQFDGCNSFADVNFTASDPCGQFTVTSARFTVADRTPPTITQVARTEVFECDDAANPGQINNYVSSRGGATAVDSCSFITWTNNFVDGPTECGPAVSITFTATDACGNFANTVGTISIEDSVSPSFVSFPIDRELGCDQDIHPDTAGRPVVFDACDADITATWTDVQFKEPDEGFCPGDLVTFRTWTATDDCGNTHSQEQVVTTVFALASGPCTPTQCPPCELEQCCEVVPNQVACNPVPCLEVACLTTGCAPVPCIPNADCQGVIDVDDDDVVGPAPVPSPLPPVDCEPVYIYVFDDDDTNVNGGDNNPVIRETESASSTLVYSFALLLVFLSALI